MSVELTTGKRVPQATFTTLKIKLKEMEKNDSENLQKLFKAACSSCPRPSSSTLPAVLQELGITGLQVDTVRTVLKAVLVSERNRQGYPVVRVQSGLKV